MGYPGKTTGSYRENNSIQLDYTHVCKQMILFECLFMHVWYSLFANVFHIYIYISNKRILIIWGVRRPKYFTINYARSLQGNLRICQGNFREFSGKKNCARVWEPWERKRRHGDDKRQDSPRHQSSRRDSGRREGERSRPSSSGGSSSRRRAESGSVSKASDTRPSASSSHHRHHSSGDRRSLSSTSSRASPDRRSPPSHHERRRDSGDRTGQTYVTRRDVKLSPKISKPPEKRTITVVSSPARQSHVESAAEVQVPAPVADGPAGADPAVAPTTLLPLHQLAGDFLGITPKICHCQKTWMCLSFRRCEHVLGSALWISIKFPPYVPSKFGKEVIPIAYVFTLSGVQIALLFIA